MLKSSLERGSGLAKKLGLLGVMLCVGVAATAQEVAKAPVAAASAAATAADPSAGIVPKPVVIDAFEGAIAELYQELRNPVLGEFDCGPKIKILVAKDPRIEGRYHVNLGKKRYHMHAHDTTTGVIRLEDSAEGVVWLQLGNKSMLMNAKLGRRMADDCTSEPQRRLVQLLKDKPKEDLLK
jgi:hypothetical protein